MKQRTIKFKAKCLNSNEWVEGDLCHGLGGGLNILCFQEKEDGSLYFYGSHQINPSTVCQFTGMKDKNGKEIWEHDIVKDGNLTMVVAFEDGMLLASGYLLYTLIENISVIGNEFDRKEEK